MADERVERLARLLAEEAQCITDEGWRASPCMAVDHRAREAVYAMRYDPARRAEAALIRLGGAVLAALTVPHGPLEELRAERGHDPLARLDGEKGR